MNKYRKYQTDWRYAKLHNIPMSLVDIHRANRKERVCELCGFSFVIGMQKNWQMQRYCKREECIKERIKLKNQNQREKKMYGIKSWGDKKQSMYWSIVNKNKEREKRVEWKKPEPPPKQASGKYWWENGHMVEKNPPAVKK